MILARNPSAEYINIQDDDGNTALMSAIKCGNYEGATKLLDTGKCNTNLVNKNGENCAHLAAFCCNLDLLKRLSETTDLTAVTYANATVLHYAAIVKINWDMISWLLINFPDIPCNSINSYGASVIGVMKYIEDEEKYIKLVKEIRGLDIH